MRIALLVSRLFGGGAERVASEISRHFSEDGHSVFIFTRFKTKKDYTYKGRIVPIQWKSHIHLGNLKDINKICEILSMVKPVKTLKKKYKIDLTISFGEPFNLLNVLSRDKDKVVTRVCTILSSENSELKGLFYNKHLINIMYNRMSDRVVVLTEYGKMELVKTYGVAPDKIAVISNPVSTFEETESDAKPWTYGKNTIICPLRITRLKQQKLLVECFKKVKSMLPDAKLLLVGDDVGDYAEDVKKQVKRLHLEQSVIITGHKKNIQYYMKNSNCFILTSKGEGFSSAIVEALSLGLPVLSTDCPGGPREILAPGTGLGCQQHIKTIEMAEYGILLPYINEEDQYKKPDDEVAKKTIVNAIIQILSSDEMQEKYAQKGKERAKCYSMNLIGKRWDSLVDGLF